MIEPTRKRRRKPRPLRFAEIEVGHVLIHHRKTLIAVKPPRPLKPANDAPQDSIYVPTIVTSFAVVTDLWFDPVYGQAEESAGQMVGVQYWVNGEGRGSKWSHNRLGLARSGWNYATAEEIAGEIVEQDRRRRLVDALRSGEVEPIRRLQL